jgi:hypothetical protein
MSVAVHPMKIAVLPHPAVNVSAVRTVLESLMVDDYFLVKSELLHRYLGSAKNIAPCYTSLLDIWEGMGNTRTSLGWYEAKKSATLILIRINEDDPDTMIVRATNRTGEAKKGA